MRSREMQSTIILSVGFKEFEKPTKRRPTAARQVTRRVYFMNASEHFSLVMNKKQFDVHASPHLYQSGTATHTLRLMTGQVSLHANQTAVPRPQTAVTYRSRTQNVVKTNVTRLRLTPPSSEEAAEFLGAVLTPPQRSALRNAPRSPRYL